MLDRATLPDPLSHYRRYGYAVVRGVFSRAEMIAVATAFDRHWTKGIAHPSTFRHGNLLYRLGIDPKLGKDAGGVRTCVAGDTSPPGTVLEGYKKVVTRTMFGETCRWEPVNQ